MVKKGFTVVFIYIELSPLFLLFRKANEIRDQSVWVLAEAIQLNTTLKSLYISSE